MTAITELDQSSKPAYGYWVLDNGEDIAVKPYGHNDAMQAIATAAGDVSLTVSVMGFHYRDFTGYGILKQNAMRVVGAAHGMVSVNMSMAKHSRASVVTLCSIADRYLLSGGHRGIIIEYCTINKQEWPIDIDCANSVTIDAAGPDDFDCALSRLRTEIRNTCTVPVETMQEQLVAMENKRSVQEHLARQAMQEFAKMRL
jgi:hypothetical protein